MNPQSLSDDPNLLCVQPSALLRSRAEAARRRAASGALVAVELTLALAACAAPEPGIPDPLLAGRTARQEVERLLRAGGTTDSALAAAGAAASAPGEPPSAAASAAGTQFFQTPRAQLQAPNVANVAGSSGQVASSLQGESAELAVNFEQLPLPQFVQAVFGTMLKRGVSMDPQVAQRRDLINLRTARPQSPTELFELARAVLKSYQIAVQDIGGLIRVVPDGQSSAYLPEIRRGRALPEVPVSLRPVFYLAQLQYVTPPAVSTYVRNMFSGKVQLTDDAPRNAVLLSGQVEDVNAALAAIAVLDQPSMADRVSARIVPSFWAAEELTRRLNDVLQVEGYSVSTIAGNQAAINLLSVPPLNSIIVFARGETVLNHVLRWARDLDQPSTGRSTSGYFTYAVRNTDAADLAKTLQEIMGSTSSVSSGGQTSVTRTNRVVVNAATNTLIFQGSASDYQQYLGLLQELDRPAKTAMVSVTIAEVRLDETEQLGFEWLLKEFTRGGYRVNILNNTFGALGSTTALEGFSARINGPGGATDPRAVLQLLSSGNKVRVLSNPTVVARNGESATIQVGDDVPILTSQISNANTQTGGTTGGGVLQTIQYRTTGVILRVKPVIHSGGRIDLDIQQEVSTPARNQLGGTSSPTISTRRIETKMSLSDGNTVLLAGLMQRSHNDSATGIPYLKDVPVAGNLFKSSTESTVRTELVILVTPYIMADDFEAQALTQAFRNQFAWAAAAAPGSSLGTPRKAGDGAASPAPAASQPSPTAEREQPATQPPRPSSPRYQLPDRDPPARAEPQRPVSVAPSPQAPAQGFPATSGDPSATPGRPAAPASAPAATASRPASAASTARAASSAAATGPTAPISAPAGFRPVTDEQLKRELLDAVNRGR
jgi:general secretion pathway protein D